MSKDRQALKEVSTEALLAEVTQRIESQLTDDIFTAIDCDYDLQAMHLDDEVDILGFAKEVASRLISKGWRKCDAAVWTCRRNQRSS